MYNRTFFDGGMLFSALSNRVPLAHVTIKYFKYGWYGFLNLFLINLNSHSTGQCLFGQFPTQSLPFQPRVGRKEPGCVGGLRGQAGWWRLERGLEKGASTPAACPAAQYCRWEVSRSLAAWQAASSRGRSLCLQTYLQQPRQHCLLGNGKAPSS